MKHVLFLLYVLIFINIVFGQEFRCDYEYNEKVDGWLKFHSIPATWYDARLRCHLEGAVLASPLNRELQQAIENITFRDDNRRDIFVGIHATFSKGDFFSIEGVPLSQIPIHWDIDEPTNYNNKESCLYLTIRGTVGDENCIETRPYVCYKKNEDEEMMDDCGTLDSQYVFSNRTGSCYKFHTVPRVYSRAVMACAAEGGYLSIINSKIEALIIKSLFSLIPPSRIIRPHPTDEAYLGFSDWNEHGDWLTSHEESLEAAGYAEWSLGEPNNENEQEYCGGVNRSGLLLDLNCGTPHTFFCEKNPISLTLCYNKK